MSPVKLFYLAWDETIKSFYVMGSSLLMPLVTFPISLLTFPTTPNLASLLSTSLEFVITIDLVTGYIGLGLSRKGQGTDSTEYSGSLGPVAYGFDWAFDSTARFVICSNDSNIVHVECNVQSLSVFYLYSGENGIHYFGGLTPLPFADYILNGSGLSVTDSLGNLGTTSFTATSSDPGWETPGVGLKFSAKNQYLELPSFMLAKSTPISQASLTVSFWLKFKSASTGTGDFIFRYCSSDGSNNKLALKINDQGDLIALAANGIITQTTTTPVPKEVWKHITVSFAISDNNYNNYNFIQIYINSLRVSVTDSFEINAAFSVLATDVFRFGGPDTFLGLLYKFKIFTPGSVLITDPTPCQAAITDCAINLGVTSGTCLAFYTPCTKAGCTKCMIGPASLELCLSCDVDYTLVGSDCQLNSTIGSGNTPATSGKSKFETDEVINGIQMAVNIATKVAVALSPGSSIGITITVAGKIFSNIKYLNISYSQELNKALQTWTSDFLSLGFTIDFPDSIERHIPEASVPYVFEKYEVPASFLLNLYQQLVIFLSITGFFIVMKGLEQLLLKFNKKSIVYSGVKTVRISSQNFLLTGMYGVCGDIVLYSTLEYRSLRIADGIGSVSLVLSGLLLFLTVICFFLHIRLLFKSQRIKNQVFKDDAQKEQAIEDFNKQNEGIEVLFGDFKNETIHQPAFLFYLTFRDLIFSFILTTMFEHPLIQTIFIFSSNIIMMIYLRVVQPFTSRFTLFQQVFYEFIWLAVNVSVVTLALMDGIEASALTSRKNIGKLIIVVNYIFNFACLTFVGICLFLAAKEAYQARQTLKRKNLDPRFDQKALPDIDKNFRNESSLILSPSLINGRNNPRLPRGNGNFSALHISRVQEERPGISLEFNSSLEDSGFAGTLEDSEIQLQQYQRRRNLKKPSNNLGKAIMKGERKESLNTFSSPNLKGGTEKIQKKFKNLKSSEQLESQGLNDMEMKRYRTKKVRNNMLQRLNDEEEIVEGLPPHVKQLFELKNGKPSLK